MKTTTIRQEYPCVYQITKGGRKYYRVDMRKKFHTGQKTKNFKTAKEALEYARKFREQTDKNGLISVAPISFDSRIDAWAKQFAFYGVTLEQGIALGLSACANEVKRKESPFVSELLTLWRDDKTTSTDKPLRPASIAAIKAMANTFIKDWGDKRIGDIDRKFLEDEYLKGKAITNRSKINMRSYISQFFNWCEHKEYIKDFKNPTKHIVYYTEVKGNEPLYLSIEQAQEIMRLAKDTKVMAYYALCLFAGIRPLEAARMNWGMVNMETKEIHLPATITKTKKSRIIDMEENLIKWLELADKNQPLIPANRRKLDDKAMATLSFTWVSDYMRHSFCSYYFAKYKDNGLNKLANIMGNSPTVIDKFYKGIISKVKFEGYWNITPDSLKASIV